MRNNGQLKAVVAYGTRDWESSLPVAGNSTDKLGYAPLGKAARAAEPEALLRLNDQGLSEIVEGPVEARAIVQSVIDAAAAQTRSGRIPANAEVLARWDIPLPTGLPGQDAQRFCELAYQFMVRSAPIEHELYGIAEKGILEIWFVPLVKDGRGQLHLSTRNLMTRSEYLDLYERLRGYMESELGYPVDIDADDTMFKEMGYTEAERREAIAERDEARSAARETGEKLKQDAQSYVRGFANGFRRTFRS